MGFLNSNGAPSFKELVKVLNNSNNLSSEDMRELISKFQNAQREYSRSEEKKKREADIKRRKAEEAERLRQAEQAHIEEVTSMELPLDWNNAFECDDRAAGVYATSIADGLILSQNNLGRVDIEYIAQITGRDCGEVIKGLKGAIYQNPDTWEECFYKGWETADEYLSGSLMTKYKAAREADKKYHGYFSENVKAIESVLPAPLAIGDIYVTLGSPWVPADIIDSFIIYLFGGLPGRLMDLPESYKVRHDPITGCFTIPDKARYGYSIKVQKYSTRRIGALHIIEHLLNMQQIKIYDSVPSGKNKSGVARRLNTQETIAANEMGKVIREKFENWVWKSPIRRERLEMIYENKFSSYRQRHFDGSFLEFPEMAEDFELYPYQKDAVAKILFTPNTLLAHDVGSGKTFIMVASGMKLRQMGISNKNMYVVPKNLVSQWESMFKRVYPNARLFCISSKNFNKHNMAEVLTRVMNEDFDAIIIASSCFDRIPISKQYYEDTLMAALREIDDYLSKHRFRSNGLMDRQEKLRKKLQKLRDEVEEQECPVTFDMLGINTLFVDEAHHYKNLPIPNNAGVLGISAAGSKKCAMMLDKVNIVQGSNNGRGVVFATATPYASPYQH